MVASLAKCYSSEEIGRNMVMYNFYDCFSWFAKLFILVCSSCSV